MTIAYSKQRRAVAKRDVVDDTTPVHPHWASSLSLYEGSDRTGREIGRNLLEIISQGLQHFFLTSHRRQRIAQHIIYDCRFLNWFGHADDPLHPCTTFINQTSTDCDCTSKTTRTKPTANSTT